MFFDIFSFEFGDSTLIQMMGDTTAPLKAPVEEMEVEVVGIDFSVVDVFYLFFR